MTLYEELIQGLSEAESYAKNKTKLRTKKIYIKELPSYTSNQIKSTRRELQLTQKEFSKLMGVSTKTVEAWESGKNIPSGASLRLLQLFKSNPSIVQTVYKKEYVNI
ncbi:helix-turn-helix domain-containing protein [Macrococcus capreoli]